ncbi:hypothetical protein, partial [Paenibacillus typhae]
KVHDRGIELIESDCPTDDIDAIL